MPDSTILTRPAHHSFVLEKAAASPEIAHSYFAYKLSVEADASDVHADLERGTQGFLLIDARTAQQYADCHIPGAVSMPHRSISAESTAQLSPEVVIVAYCWGPGCNAATRACAKLSALGFRVKEMIGGLEYWRHEGYSVEGALGADAPMYG